MQKSDLLPAFLDGTEFWYARDLQKLLGYTNWQNFSSAIGRAIESCETAKFDSGEHFSAITKMITLGQGGKREIEGAEIACGMIMADAWQTGWRGIHAMAICRHASSLMAGR